MAQLGADVEQLDRMAAKFEQHAGQIEDTDPDPRRRGRERLVGRKMMLSVSRATGISARPERCPASLSRNCTRLPGQVKKQAAQQRQTSQA